LAIGLGARAIDYRVRVGRLHAAYAGVYTLGYPAVTPHERAMAAVLAGGPGAALSHGSAMSLWGIWKRWDTPFHVTVKADRRPKGVKVHRASKLDRRDITRHHGIPVTTLARTLLDMAPRMTPKSLTRAVNDGRQNRHVGLDALADVIARSPQHRGATKLKSVLGLCDDRPTRSGFEDDFVEFCRTYGLPTPRVNRDVAGHEADIVFVEEKVIVELDSWLFHWSRSSFEDERKRDTDTLLADHVTVRLTDERFDNEPAQVASDLHTILTERRKRAA
jgi:very-short-patch-repair endonuclease